MARLLKNALRGVLEPHGIQQLQSGIDVVGDIAVIRVPDSLLAKKRVIARALLESLKPVKTVLRQASPVLGEHRTRELEHLAGEDRTWTTHREHGCLFKVDLAKVFFTPRLSTERLRIASEVRPEEVVVNMFAGVGSYSVIIAKKQPAARVYSIDVNPEAHLLQLESIRMNKVEGRVIPVLGEAGDVIRSSLAGTADRIVMPLPGEAYKYLAAAVTGLKPSGGVINYYAHVHASKGEDPLELAAKDLESRLDTPHRIVFARTVREVGPRWSEVALDVAVGLTKR